MLTNMVRSPVMRLSQYLEKQKMSDAAFARLVGVSSEAVRRYKAKRVPQPSVMEKIIAVTDGQVQPNDFFKLREAS